MAPVRDRAESTDPLKSEVFDGAHLAHYTMHDQRLAAEVLGLFLAQLPSTLHLLEAAETLAEWKSAAHALKGSAAAVGAPKVKVLASGLETLDFPGEAGIRLLRIQALKAALAEFRDVVRRSYPGVAEP